jgi:hypothetical protein
MGLKNAGVLRIVIRHLSLVVCFQPKLNSFVISLTHNKFIIIYLSISIQLIVFLPYGNLGVVNKDGRGIEISNG